LASPFHLTGQRILEDLSFLMGFSTAVDLMPFGARPDVLRFDPATRGLFLGDAKATERPDCRDTRFRYLNYIRWLSMSRARTDSSVCAICFSQSMDGAHWAELLKAMLIGEGYLEAMTQVSDLGQPYGAVWATLGSRRR
jgi:hypothetical protein